jgi:hypothetical protein
MHVSFPGPKYLLTGLSSLNKVRQFISWNFRNSEADWKYAFSVDGHIYQTKEIIEMTKLLSFKATNTYKATMNVFGFIFWRRNGMPLL